MLDKVIFLDVDGVLNSIDSEDRFKGFIGLDYSSIKLLKEIVDKTNAIIVLVSTWKLHWYRDAIDKEDYQDDLGYYLDRRLSEEGLKIFDKTFESNMDNRGEGINAWLEEHPNVKSWIILDDEIFDDYERYGCIEHLIKTDFYDGGLKDSHVQEAISRLNNI